DAVHGRSDTMRSHRADRPRQVAGHQYARRHYPFVRTAARRRPDERTLQGAARAATLRECGERFSIRRSDALHGYARRRNTRCNRQRRENVPRRQRIHGCIRRAARTDRRGRVYRANDGSRIPEPGSREQAMTELAIHVQDLTRTFGGFTAVDHISFDVKPGEVFGFLGANGAGKTTAIRMLIGLLQPSSGSARVAGYDVARDTEQVKRSLGYMSQRFSLYEDLTPRENIRL